MVELGVDRKSGSLTPRERKEQRRLLLQSDPYRIGWSPARVDLFRETERARATREGDTLGLLEFRRENDTATRLYHKLRRIGACTVEGVGELLAIGQIPRGFGPKSWPAVGQAYESFQIKYSDKNEQALRAIYEESEERRLKGPYQAGMTNQELERFRREEEERLQNPNLPRLDQLDWGNYTWEFAMRWGTVVATRTRNTLNDFGVCTVNGARQILDRLDNGQKIFGVGPKGMELLRELLEKYDQQHPQAEQH